MTKYKPVIGEIDADEMGFYLASKIGFDNVTPELVRAFCWGSDWAEQNVLAKLHEQEPVAIVSVSQNTGLDIIWHQFQGLVDGTPLYAHPTQSMERKIVGYSDKEGEYFFQKLETAKRIAPSLDFCPVYIDIDDCASLLRGKPNCVSENAKTDRQAHDHRSEFISAYKALLCPGETVTFALDRITGCFINEFVEHAWVVWQIAKGLLALDHAEERGCSCDE